MEGSKNSSAHSLDVCDSYCKDSDTCSSAELDELFSKYSFISDLKLIKDNEKSKRCTKLVNNPSESKIAVCNVEGSVHIIDVSSNTSTLSKIHSNTITEMKFIDDNLLYSSSHDGLIKCFDIRCNKITSEFKDGCDVKPLTCLDINFSHDYVAAGTTYINNEDSFILFWDRRNPNSSMGSYWECHSDEITTVKYHPFKKHYLLSGAMDNLVNFYDISKKSEEESFLDCIKLDWTPDVVYWDPNSECSSKVYVVNYPQNIQYWDVNGTRPEADLTSVVYCKAIKRNLPSQCHYISCCFGNSDLPIILGSSNLGLENPLDVCVRTAKFERNSKNLRPHCMLDLHGTKIDQIIDGIYLPTIDHFAILTSKSLLFWKKSSKRSLDSDENSKSFKKSKFYVK